MVVSENENTPHQVPRALVGKHRYLLMLFYSNDENNPILLVPSSAEAHRWMVPDVYLERALKPKEIGTKYKIVVYSLGGVVLNEHVGVVPVPRMLHIELLGDHRGCLEDNLKSEYLSAVIWSSNSFQSVCVKMEKHLPLFYA